MLYSRSFIQTLRETPSEAEAISHQLMLRAGLIRKVAGGIYDWLPTGLRVLRKVEQIVREEMNKAGGLEVWLPQMQPRELWEETGRWPIYGRELIRFKDRKNADFCLAPTAEEVVTDLVRREVKSYRALPLMLYQFGLKYRDEIRPRFGIMRAREFYMKDGYSFHADEADAERYYHVMVEAYKNIFTKFGLQFRPVEAESGAIGGSFSHEFMVLADIGEEGIVSCSCGYAANVERAELPTPSALETQGTSEPIANASTPKAVSVDDVAKLLDRPKKQFIKLLVVLADDKPIGVLLRGDHELNEAKLMRYLNCTRVVKANEATYTELTGSPVGFAGPVNSKTQFIADFDVLKVTDGVAGANEVDVHLIHVVPGRDFKPSTYADLRKAAAGDPCPCCSKPLDYHRGIEVGHTFKLGTKYSTSMKANFLNAAKESKPLVMGCYGIGVSRVVAACVEQSHDSGGIIWPTSLAPWQLVIVPLNLSSAPIKEAADRLYKEAQSAGIEVLFDDREDSAGVKLKDADLLGIPWRIVIGDRKISSGLVEFKARTDATLQEAPVSQIIAKIQALL
jgi:prolyl-tRNA synthetase